MRTTIRLRRGSYYEWEQKNPILEDGEPGYETLTNRYKIGDGNTAWRDLPYFFNEDDIRQLVIDVVEHISIDTNPVPEGSSAALVEHINDTTPHPAYDDYVSFALRFENGLV